MRAYFAQLRWPGCAICSTGNQGRSSHRRLALHIAIEDFRQKSRHRMKHWILVTRCLDRSTLLNRTYCSRSTDRSHFFISNMCIDKIKGEYVEQAVIKATHSTIFSILSFAYKAEYSIYCSNYVAHLKCSWKCESCRDFISSVKTSTG